MITWVRNLLKIFILLFVISWVNYDKYINKKSHKNALESFIKLTWIAKETLHLYPAADFCLTTRFLNNSVCTRKICESTQLPPEGRFYQLTNIAKRLLTLILLKLLPSVNDQLWNNQSQFIQKCILQLYLFSFIVIRQYEIMMQNAT